jgi:uncharacterized protein (DUF427 family)
MLPTITVARGFASERDDEVQHMFLKSPDDPRIAELIVRSRAHARLRPPANQIAVPGIGQESVWDYPRPPRVEPVTQSVEIRFKDSLIAATTQALRVLETSGAPAFYISESDIAPGIIRKTPEWGLCEWKGIYYFSDLVIGNDVVSKAGWTFPKPLTDLGCGYEALAGRYAFYPSKVECYLAGERARPQPGGYYGGWVTSRVTGPFKGAPGSENW